MRAHLYDYGPSCRKLTINQWLPLEKRQERSYYMKCEALNCCYKDADIMKKWDLHDTHLLQPVKIKYMGMQNTTGLDNVTVLAERWHEDDTVAFGVAHVSYDYFITREGEDVITHRIDYGASKIEPGAILYADFQVQHNLTEFEQVFQISDECQKAMQCPDSLLAKWDMPAVSK